MSPEGEEKGGPGRLLTSIAGEQHLTIGDCGRDIFEVRI